MVLTFLRWVYNRLTAQGKQLTRIEDAVARLTPPPVRSATLIIVLHPPTPRG
jgi:hypothetical protein